MNCEVCKRDQGPDGTNPVVVLGVAYNLCPFDQLEIERFIQMRKAGEAVNINWGGGKLAIGCWDEIRRIIRENGIKEVLEFGAGLSSELFVNEGLGLVSFDVLDFHIAMLKRCLRGRADLYAYEYGVPPPVKELYPGRKWEFVFVDGPQERSREVRTAMDVSTKFIYLHDPNAGEESFFPNEEWEALSIKLFKKRGT